MPELNIGPGDINKLVSLPLRSNAVFNSFLAMYARMATPSGCKKCGRGNPAASQAQLINSAGAALKSLSNTDRTMLKKTLETHFKASPGTVNINLGGFKFVI